MTYQLLIALPEEVWDGTVTHPRDGAISLDRWVELQERHIPHHIEQMRQNFEIWLKTHPPRRRPSPSRAPGISSGLVSMNAGIC
jgi:heme A synthase